MVDGDPLAKCVLILQWLALFLPVLVYMLGHLLLLFLNALFLVRGLHDDLKFVFHQDLVCLLFDFILNLLDLVLVVLQSGLTFLQVFLKFSSGSLEVGLL